MFLEKNSESLRFSQFKSFKATKAPAHHTSKIKWMAAIVCLLIAALFLPWTQNVRSRGNVSTLDPKQRPQQINSLIPGRILKWHIQNGAMVNKGDTLLQISETKDEYLDPELVQRTSEQLNAKNSATAFYKNKVSTAELQIKAMEQSLQLKIAQLKNKIKQYTLQIQSDSIAMTAASGQFNIANVQLKRQQELYQQGLKSLVEYEQRQQYYQDAIAKKISTENKFYTSKNELINLRLELSSTSQDYAEKISKISGERFNSLSEAATGDGEVSKLRNQLFNYQARKNFYYIIAPQDGQVLQSDKAGIGETVKDGEKLLTIVPKQIQKAIEIEVDPNDMPLINKGQLVRIQFDGFPAIIFSGWPEASYGLFSGRVAAIDNTIDISGKFKVWVLPDETDKKWPVNVRFGTGCQVIALLNNVSIWYELWRQLNGFPPNFYNPLSKGDVIKKK